MAHVAKENVFSFWTTEYSIVRSTELTKSGHKIVKVLYTASLFQYFITTVGVIECFDKIDCFDDHHSESSRIYKQDSPLDNSQIKICSGLIFRIDPNYDFRHRFNLKETHHYLCKHRNNVTNIVKVKTADSLSNLARPESHYDHIWIHQHAT